MAAYGQADDQHIHDFFTQDGIKILKSAKQGHVAAGVIGVIHKTHHGKSQKGEVLTLCKEFLAPGVGPDDEQIKRGVPPESRMKQSGQQKAKGCPQRRRQGQIHEDKQQQSGLRPKDAPKEHHQGHIGQENLPVPAVEFPKEPMALGVGGGPVAVALAQMNPEERHQLQHIDGENIQGDEQYSSLGPQGRFRKTYGQGQKIPGSDAENFCRRP